MNCDTALEIMLDAQHAQRREALNYILQHPICLARLDQFARAIVAETEEEMPCAQAREQLADYYTEQQAGRQVAQTMPAIHAHVQRCPYCQLELRLLAETMQMAATDQLPALQTLAPLDLTFIDTLLPAAPTLVWVMQNHVRRLFQELVVSVQSAKTAIAALSPDLTPQTFALSMRGEDDAQYDVLILPDQEAQVRFRVVAKPMPDGAALIALRIVEAQTDAPIPDVRVTLRTIDQHLVAGSLTNNNGEIEFPRIAPNRYVIQARHADQTWELPIAVARV
ncbi:MAG: carboxypeptidase-like regulatory domain-containing protein [Caldilineaceae bacterium]